MRPLVDIVTVFQCHETGCAADKHYAKGLCRKHYLVAYQKANRISAADRSRRYRERHPDRVKNQNKNQSDQRKSSGYWLEYRSSPEYYDRRRVYMRSYQKANPQSYRFQSARRRARILEAPGFHSLDEWLERLAEFNGLCAYCLNVADTKDHVVALAVGGSDSIDNVVPACLSCNLTKGTKSIGSLGWEIRWPS